MHKRPILVEPGVDGNALADEVVGFLMVAVDDGGLMPVGFGKRDDAVDISLFNDISDGVGDEARCSPSGNASEFVSLIFLSLLYSTFVLNVSDFFTLSIKTEII